MDPMFWVALPEIIAVGAASLVGVLAVGALSARFALRSTRSSLGTARQQAELQERRIELLEAEIATLRHEVRSRSEVEAFDRQLGTGNRP
ncbi:MAG TPA: hypothetical protein VFH27_10170 [Longimicrobiaceae bacterium]|nr:hypothetical protein [Longimicrobiaceae bacterium]